jgi:hypothetical protein
MVSGKRRESRLAVNVLIFQQFVYRMLGTIIFTVKCTFDFLVLDIRFLSGVFKYGPLYFVCSLRDPRKLVREMAIPKLPSYPASGGIG